MVAIVPGFAACGPAVPVAEAGAVATTNPAHISIGIPDLPTARSKESNAWEVTKSGNSVSLEQEMMKAGDVNRSYSLNTNVVKAFNSMMSSALKG